MRESIQVAGHPADGTILLMPLRSQMTAHQSVRPVTLWLQEDLPGSWVPTASENGAVDWRRPPECRLARVRPFHGPP